MQQQARALKLLCLLACVGLSSAWTSKEDTTNGWLRTWLRARLGKDAPNTDDLAELARENPTAYALVKSLLVKQSLGLLKRRPDAVTTTDVDGGDADTDAEVSAPPQHHGNFFNWKPADDTATVQNVLGQVASLASANPTQQKTDQAAADEIVVATATNGQEHTAVAPTTETTVAAEPAASTASTEQTDSTASAGATSQSTDSIFAKGAAMLAHKTESSTFMTAQAGAGTGKAGAWGNIFGGFSPHKKEKKVVQHKSKDSDSGNNSYLKGFDWGTDVKELSLAAHKTVNAEDNSAQLQSNSYTHFLS